LLVTKVVEGSIVTIFFTLSKSAYSWGYNFSTREKRYSRRPRLSDTRYSTKGSARLQTTQKRHRLFPTSVLRFHLDSTIGMKAGWSVSIIS